MIERLSTAAFAATSIGLLAACGGSGGDGGNTISFGDSEARYDAIDARLDATPPTGTLRDMGTVSYSGLIFAEIDTGGEIYGDMTMDVNFEDSTIAGGVTNIVDDSNGQYSGNLMIDGSVTAAAEIQADLVGILNNPQDRLYSVNADMTGNFYGDDEQFVFGNITGSVQSPDLPGGTSDIVYGEFIGEQ